MKDTELITCLLLRFAASLSLCVYQRYPLLFALAIALTSPPDFASCCVVPEGAAACGVCDQTLTLTLHTDDYGYETYWNITSDCAVSGCSSDLSLVGGPYQAITGGELIVQVLSTTVCALQSYTFIMFDDYGDGLNPALGFYSLMLDSGGTVASGGVFAYADVTTFVVPVRTTVSPTSTPTQSPRPTAAAIPTPISTILPQLTPTAPPAPIPTARPSFEPTSLPTYQPTPEPTRGPVSPTSDDTVACGTCDQTLTLTLHTDGYGSETYWNLTTGNVATGCSSDISVVGGPYANIPGGELIVQVLSSTVCALQSYTFSIFDDFGDGLNNKTGYYSLALDSGDVVASGVNFRFAERTTFVVPYQSPSPTHAPTAFSCVDFDIALFDSYGDGWGSVYLEVRVLLLLFKVDAGSDCTYVFAVAWGGP